MHHMKVQLLLLQSAFAEMPTYMYCRGSRSVLEYAWTVWAALPLYLDGAIESV